MFSAKSSRHLSPGNLLCPKDLRFNEDRGSFHPGSLSTSKDTGLPELCKFEACIPGVHLATLVSDPSRKLAFFARLTVQRLWLRNEN
jgi:hypothetical protein